jgi:hypothetical protein
LLELVIKLAKSVSHVSGRSHGSEGVILVQSRNAEHGQHSVADELLDRAAVPLEHRTHLGVVAGHYAPNRFRIEALSHAGRTGQITEDQRDGLSCLGRGWAAGQKRSTGRTKTRVFRALLAAFITERHRAECMPRAHRSQ